MACADSVHLMLDHTSILRMIEWRFGLEPLTIRDATANNLAEVLDFTTADFAPAKQLAVPTGTFGALCTPGLPDPTDEEWLPLLQMAVDFGWPVNAETTA
jgi:phospholipase C